MKGIARKVSSDVAESFRPLTVKDHYPMPNFGVFYGGSHGTPPWEVHREQGIVVLWVPVVSI